MKNIVNIHRQAQRPAVDPQDRAVAHAFYISCFSTPIGG